MKREVLAAQLETSASNRVAELRDERQGLLRLRRAERSRCVARAREARRRFATCATCRVTARGGSLRYSIAPHSWSRTWLDALAPRHAGRTWLSHSSDELSRSERALPSRDLTRAAATFVAARAHAGRLRMRGPARQRRQPVNPYSRCGLSTSTLRCSAASGMNSGIRSTRSPSFGMCFLMFGCGQSVPHRIRSGATSSSA